MNYIRKIVAFILSIIFCVALLISFGIIYAVKNVNVAFIKYSAEGSDEEIMKEYNADLESFERLKGGNMLFVSESDITKKIESSNYIFVASWEKVFPCTINITLKERTECLAYQVADGYQIYDETGVLLRKSKTNINNTDGSPNVLIKSDITNIAYFTKLCVYFKNSFGSLRNLVESVEIEESLIEHTNTFTFNLYSGVKIIIADYTVLAEEKINCAYVEYLSLSDSEKLGGAIRVIDRNGDVATVEAFYIR